jgi:rubrerythrin
MPALESSEMPDKQVERRAVMTDRYTKAVEESEKKSAFICESCGHPHDIASPRPTPVDPSGGVKDRFSEAVKESAEKSAFVCTSCGHQQGLGTGKKK